MRARLATAALAVAAGCGHFAPPADDSAGSGDTDSCQHRALIDDGEDGDDRILPRAGRGGYIYNYVDERGSKIQSAGGALRVNGTLTTGDDTYAGVGFSFTDPRAAYDASSWTGVAFKARARKPLRIRLKVPDGTTDPGGKVCTECYNDFGVDFEVGAEWTRYQVAFADLKQESGWGAPRSDAIDAAALHGMQWQITAPGEFELWIDDVAFVECP